MVHCSLHVLLRRSAAEGLPVEPNPIDGTFELVPRPMSDIDTFKLHDVTEVVPSFGFLPEPGMMYHSSLSFRQSVRRAGVVFHSGLLNGQGAAEEGKSEEGKGSERGKGHREGKTIPRKDRRHSRNRPRRRPTIAANIGAMTGRFANTKRRKILCKIELGRTQGRADKEQSR